MTEHLIFAGKVLAVVVAGEVLGITPKVRDAIKSVTTPKPVAGGQ